MRTLTPTHFIHFTMAPESELSQPVPEGWATFVYTLKGAGNFAAGTVVLSIHTVTPFVVDLKGWLNNRVPVHACFFLNPRW